MSEKLTTEKWIEKAVKKHGNKFDYSKSIYTKSNENIEIICKKHGSFWQNASIHVNRGSGCFKCAQEEKADNNRTPKEDFINKSSKKHNNKFDYSLLHNYKSLTEHLTIICPIHGVFKQVGSSHLAGYDCEKCSYDKRGLKNRIPKEEIKRRLEELDNDLIYDLSSYENTNSKISYTCSLHGKIEQGLGRHLRGGGCCRCNKSTSWNTSNTEEFIEKALSIHKKYYSYTKSKYIRNSKKVIITCPHHGDFKQRPNNHLLGAGCPVCANIMSNFKDAEKHEIEEAKYINCSLYIMYFSEEDFYKIGISRCIKGRLKGIKYDSNSVYNPEKKFDFETNLFDAAFLEHKLHTKYRNYKYKPKTYFRGHTECFTTDIPIKEIQDYLLNLP